MPILIYLPCSAQHDRVLYTWVVNQLINLPATVIIMAELVLSFYSELI